MIASSSRRRRFAWVGRRSRRASPFCQTAPLTVARTPASHVVTCRRGRLHRAADRRISQRSHIRKIRASKTLYIFRDARSANMSVLLAAQIHISERRRHLGNNVLLTANRRNTVSVAASRHHSSRATRHGQRRDEPAWQFRVDNLLCARGDYMGKGPKPDLSAI